MQDTIPAPHTNGPRATRRPNGVPKVTAMSPLPDDRFYGDNGEVIHITDAELAADIRKFIDKHGRQHGWFPTRLV